METPPDRFAGDQPIDRHPRIVIGHARCVRARADRNAKVQHFPDWRGPFGRLLAVTLYEVFALVSHPMLNRDAAAQSFDALQIPVGHGLAMVKEPVQAFERDLAIDFLKDIQKPRDALIVGCVQSKWPFGGK